jgi:hypothetical protein
VKSLGADNLVDEPASLSIDVGVDSHDFQPWHLHDIRRVMETKRCAPRRELAFEYGVLQMIAVATHGLEDLAKALVVRNVVTDKI